MSYAHCPVFFTKFSSKYFTQYLLNSFAICFFYSMFLQFAFCIVQKNMYVRERKREFLLLLLHFCLLSAEKQEFLLYYLQGCLYPQSGRSPRRQEPGLALSTVPSTQRAINKTHCLRAAAPGEAVWSAPPSLSERPFPSSLFPASPQQQLQKDVGLENWNEVTRGSGTPHWLHEQLGLGVTPSCQPCLQKDICSGNLARKKSSENEL